MQKVYLLDKQWMHSWLISIFAYVRNIIIIIIIKTSFHDKYSAEDLNVDRNVTVILNN